jgi:hypothetical protein
MKSTCSVLGKRKYGNAFHYDSYDDSRYGNHIGADFFKNGGVGHGVKITDNISDAILKTNNNKNKT